MLGRAKAPQDGHLGSALSSAALRRVDFGLESIGGPDGRGTGVQALQVVNRAVALVNDARVKPGFLKLAVDVAGKHRMTQRHVLPPALEHLKACVRLRLAVVFESMAIKTHARCGRSRNAAGLAMA